MNIFVAKLNFESQESSVMDAFSQYGEVVSVKIIQDKFSGRSKGFGFVEMPNEEEALAAIESLNGSELDARTIVVKKAESRERRDDSRGGGENRY